MQKDSKLEKNYAQLMKASIEKKCRKEKNVNIDLNQLISKCSEKVNKEFSMEMLRINGVFLAQVSLFLLQMIRKLMSDFDLFKKTQFLQIDYDALSTKDKPVKKRRAVYQRKKQVEDKQEEQNQLLANQELIASISQQSPQLNLIILNQEMPNMLDLQFQDIAEPNLNLIEQLPEQPQQPNIDQQEAMQVEEQINVTGGLNNETYKRSKIEKKKRQRYDYILDNMNNKVVNKFIEDQVLEKFITGKIQLGVKRLQNEELISVLLNVQPKVRIYSHLLPSKLELRQFEQRGRPVQELRGQNVTQEQLQDFGFGFGFLDDKPSIQQEPPQDIHQSQQHSQQMDSQLMYTQQMDIELKKNFTYSFQHSGLLFNSFLNRQDKSLKFYLLMCQCQKSKNFRIEQEDVLQFGPIKLIKKQ